MVIEQYKLFRRVTPYHGSGGKLLVFSLNAWEPDTNPAGNKIVEIYGHHRRGVVIGIRVIGVT